MWVLALETILPGKSEVDTLYKVTEGKVVYGIVTYIREYAKRKSIGVCVCAHSAPIYYTAIFLSNS